MGKVKVKLSLRAEPVEVDEAELPVLRSQGLLAEDEPEPVTKTSAATPAAGTPASKETS
jgi:hypothetical protein